MVTTRHNTRRRGWWAQPLPAPGDDVGTYEIVEYIGSGGMASVFLARLQNDFGFGKLFALKLLHRDLADNPILVEMFVHEAKIGVLLSHHPNISQVLELGQWRGTFFLAMEYLEGLPLSELTASGEPMDPGVVCAIGMQACEALAAVHHATDQAGRSLDLVHLDVSPQNLILTSSGTLKLIDFGISRSRLLGEIVPANPFRAKYSYTSPERLQDGEPDSRSDLFSLGTVLWELLAGRRLFSGENELQTMYRVSRAEIPSLVEERSDIPEELDRVISKALSRSPDSRFQSALELHQALYQASRALGERARAVELAALVRNPLADDDGPSANAA